MAKNNYGGRSCCGRRGSNNIGCLESVGGCRRWDNFPYYDSCCPDADGRYEAEARREDADGDCRGRRRRCGRDGDFGIFTAYLPMAVAANGVVPLVNGTGCCGGDGFDVNCGMVTVRDAGMYLATYTVRVPEGVTVDSTVTLNVNDAVQSSAVTMVGGAGPNSYTAQAIFDAGDRSTVTLRSSEAIIATESSVQPMFTLSLVRLDGEA